jgi:hypothetical protein
MASSRPRRIAFSERDAAHAYEWLVMFWRGDRRGRFGGCAQCALVGARLERFLGASEARRIRRAVDRHPGEPQIYGVPDAENPELTAEYFANARPLREALPELARALDDATLQRRAATSKNSKRTGG